MQTPENRKASNDKYYAANRARVQALNKANIERNKVYVTELKKKPCLDCGKRYPSYVMDFDHVSGTKVKDISKLVRNGCSISTIDAEVAKCELVCANCHRERTHQRLHNITDSVAGSYPASVGSIPTGGTRSE